MTTEKIVEEYRRRRAEAFIDLAEAEAHRAVANDDLLVPLPECVVTIRDEIEVVLALLQRDADEEWARHLNTLRPFDRMVSQMLKDEHDAINTRTLELIVGYGMEPDAAVDRAARERREAKS